MRMPIFSSLLMPSAGPLVEHTFEFQQSFIRAKGIPAVIGMLTRNNFLVGADLATKQGGNTIGFLSLKNEPNIGPKTSLR